MKGHYNKVNKNSDRYVKILRLRKGGLSFVKIGRKLGVSRQRVHQILTGYSARKIIPAIDHKILTRQKRKSIGIGDFKADSSRGGREFINEIIRHRDNYTCQICHKKWTKGHRRLDIHHIDPKWDGRSRQKGILKYNRENMDKLVALCHKCHFTLDVTRKRISRKLSPINKN